jgi:iron complex outermembrane receptor protein
VVFGTTALTEETEAAGLTRLRIPEPLKSGTERLVDVTRSVGGVTLTGTLFHYDVHDPAVVDRAAYTLNTLDVPTTSAGVEAVGTWRGNESVPFSVTGTYTYVRSLEGVGGDRGEVPLTPRHSAGLIGMWENGDMGRIGIDCYFTGAQRLDDNPYAVRSAPYVLFGGLAERRFGNLRVFVNAENLGNVRQTNRIPVAPSQAATAAGRTRGRRRRPRDQRRRPHQFLSVTVSGRIERNRRPSPAECGGRIGRARKVPPTATLSSGKKGASKTHAVLAGIVARVTV